MVLVENWPFLDFFYLGNMGQENVLYDILERKNAFLRYKNVKFKNSNKWHFSKGVSPCHVTFSALKHRWTSSTCALKLKINIKNVRSTLHLIGLGEFWIKGHDMDSTGIVDTIRQRLNNIELQHWMSEINNDIRRDTDQNNKRQHNENSKQWKITNVRITIVKLPVPATE